MQLPISLDQFQLQLDPASFFAGIATIILTIFLYSSDQKSKTRADNQAKLFSDLRGEMLTEQNITSARIHLDNISLEIAKNLSKKNTKVFDGLRASAQEMLLNAYDHACQSFLDGKLEEKRFQKRYSTHISNLFEDDIFAKKLSENNNTTYSALHKVHHQFFNTEK